MRPESATTAAPVGISSGASALSAANGRWLVYTGSKAGATFGNLDSGLRAELRHLHLVVGGVAVAVAGAVPLHARDLGLERQHPPRQAGRGGGAGPAQPRLPGGGGGLAGGGVDGLEARDVHQLQPVHRVVHQHVADLPGDLAHRERPHPHDLLERDHRQ